MYNEIRNSIKDSSIASLICILIVVFIGYVGMALPYPIFAPAILKLEAINLLNLKVSAIFYLGLITAGYPFGIFIGGFIIGLCADVFGRKKVLIVTLIGTTISYLFTAFCFVNKYYLLLIFSRIITGICESNISIAMAVASDLSNKISKANSFSYINAAMFMGYITGPILGGYLSMLSFSMPLVAASILALCSSLIVIVLFKDSYKTINNKLGATNIVPPNISYSSKTAILVCIILISLFTTLGVFNFYQFYPLYLVTSYSFDSRGIANITVVLNIGMLLSSILIIRMISKFLNNRIILIISLTSFVITLWIFINVNFSIYWLVLIFFLQGIFIPLIGINTSLILSNNVSPKSQGRSNGLITSLNGILSVVLILITSKLTDYSIKIPFQIIIILFVFAIIILSIYKSIDNFRSIANVDNIENPRETL